MSQQQRWQQRQWSQEQQRQQQTRFDQYRQNWQERQRIAEQRERYYQQQRRYQQYRFQQEYLERLRRDQYRLASSRPYYYYGGPSYRYYRGGSYYTTNEYGVNMLRQAINNGYAEGIRAGQADRQDGQRFNPQDSYAYEDAMYGFDAYYVDPSEYQYYFREGFRRGYEDGYNGNYRYGSYSNGAFSILGNILLNIFNARSY